MAGGFWAELRQHSGHPRKPPSCLNLPQRTATLAQQQARISKHLTRLLPVSYSSLQAIQAHRVGHWMWMRGRKALAVALQVGCLE